MIQVLKSFKDYQLNEEKDYLEDKIIDAEIVESVTNTKEQISEIEAGLIIAILSKISKIDGDISDFEKAYIEATYKVLANYFDDPSELVEIFQEIYENESKSSENLVDVAHQYYQETNFNYKRRLNLLNYILILLFIDGTYDEKEEIIKKIYRTFRVSKSDFENSVDVIKNTIDNMEFEALAKLDNSGMSDAILSVIPDVISDDIDDDRLRTLVPIFYTINPKKIEKE
jgi:uncharacterized tellurite resistance protein B-like protein